MISSTRALPCLSTRHVATKSILTSPRPLTRTYYSIHHPEKSPLPPIPTAILTSALEHVPRLGFTPAALLAGAKANNYREATLNLFPRGAYDLIHFYLFTQRLALKDRVQFPPSSKLSLSNRVETLLWARLQVNADAGVLPYWQDALAQMSLLENIPASLKELGNLSDEVWYLAGDTQVDFGWYTKRAGLMGVYASSEVFMTTDRSEGFRDTREFLGRRLEGVKGVGGVVGGVKQYVGWATGNGLGLARAWGMRV